MMNERKPVVVDIYRLATFLNKNGIQCFSREAAIQTLKNIETMKEGIKEEKDIEFRLQVRDYIEIYTKVLGINLAQAVDATKNPLGKSNIVSIFGDKLDLPEQKPNGV